MNIFFISDLFEMISNESLKLQLANYGNSRVAGFREMIREVISEKQFPVKQILCGKTEKTY